jgi:cellulose synthase/poly-beta-1,6-N-acetylglucosamine synthase-like glycosyltransferase
LKPVPLPSQPSYSASRDVSVIVPIIDAGSTFAEALISWVLSKPMEIIIVTVDPKIQETQVIVSRALRGMSDMSISVTVHGMPQPGKRKQISRGILKARGSIIVFADDDVFWPSTFLPYLLACFEDSTVRGAGILQYARLPAKGNPSIWQHLAAQRLEKRNIAISASNYLDGGVSCLSGRTVCYRAEILKAPAFIQSSTNDYWRGKYLLDSGDDTFINH